ncbi:MAG: YceI family protein [Flavobacteriales bacterium]
MNTFTKISLSLLFAILLISFHPAGNISKLAADKSKSYITYYMSHPAHDWSGTCKGISCNIVYNDSLKTINAVAMVCAVSCFNSDNASRDSHTLEVTEALKYPMVKFISTYIANKDSVLTVKGNLTFHNVTKAISFQAKKRYVGKEMSVVGAFSIKMTDFGIAPPTMMMAACDDLVKLEFNAAFKLN